MWIAKDSDGVVVLFKEKPTWDSDFGIWKSEEWEADISEFPEMYKYYMFEDEPIEVEIELKQILKA